MTASSGRRPAPVSWHQVETRLVLTLKQEKDWISGNLVVTDGATISEFIVRTGSVDEEGRIHLALTLKPEVSASVSAFGIGVSGGLAEALVHLDQVNHDRRRLVFRVSDSIGFIGGLATQSRQAEDTLTFIQKT